MMLIFSAIFLISLRNQSQHSHSYLLYSYSLLPENVWPCLLSVSQPWWFLTATSTTTMSGVRPVVLPAVSGSSGLPPASAVPPSPSAGRRSTWPRWRTSCARPGPWCSPSSCRLAGASRWWQTPPWAPGCPAQSSVRRWAGAGTAPGGSWRSTTSPSTCPRGLSVTRLRNTPTTARSVHSPSSTSILRYFSGHSLPSSPPS